MLAQPFTISDCFVPATAPRENAAKSQLTTWWFCCIGPNLLTILESDNSCLVPETNRIEALGIQPVRTQFLGYLRERPCVAVELAKDVVVPEGAVLQSLRSLHGVLRADLFAIAARAIQIIEWNRTHQYCGHCATPMTQLPSARAKRCPNCGLRQYPRLSLAVIMLVYKGEQLLLARAPR